MTTDEATTVLGAVGDGAVVAENQQARKIDALGSIRLKENAIDTIQRVTTSEGYLQPVDDNNLQAGPGKARLFSPGRLQVLDQSNTDKSQNNPLYERGAPIQHCSSVKPALQSNRLIRPAVGTNNNNNNDRSTTAPYRVESPYMQVLQSTNWEVSPDHLSLFERIGGGSFGQVWKGAVFDVAGDKEWSVVAVKMLKGKEQCSFVDSHISHVVS